MTAVGLVTHFGYRMLFYADAATTTLCALLIAVMVRDTTPVETIRAARSRRAGRSQAPVAGTPASGHSGRSGHGGDGLGMVLRDRTFVAFVATTFLLLIVFNQVNAGLPMAMSASGLSASAFGRIAAINGVLIVLLQMPVTRLLKRFPEGRVLAGAALVIGAGFGVLAFGQSAAMFVVCVVVMTMGEIGNTPTGQAIVARLSPDHLRGRYQGVYQLAWTLGQVAAPLAGGAVLSAFGGTPLWAGCFAVTVLTAAGFLRIGKHVERRMTAARLSESQTVDAQAVDAQTVGAQAVDAQVAAAGADQRPELATA